MSFYDEPFDPNSARGSELMEIAIVGIVDKTSLKRLVVSVGVAEIDINWDQTVREIWGDVLERVARVHLVRQFLLAVEADDNFATVKQRIVALRFACDAEVAAEQAAGVAASPPTLEELSQTTLVGPRPFVNRSTLRHNLVSLFGPDGIRTMVVGGPRSSGRSYTWVLASHVARRFANMATTLINLSRFTDTQANPVDVAHMIANSLGWTDWPDVKSLDPSAQDATNARILRPQLVRRLGSLDPTCLVFDGLDGSNLTEAAVALVGDIAAAAGNDELGECRVVLLAYNRAIPNPNVDPFVLREPLASEIPLKEVKQYFVDVAKDANTKLTKAQVNAFVTELFGKPAPDPVPVAAMRAKAAELSRVARGLRGV
ncbi:hypothetical protein GCM10009789_25910 [Kribbella sancticallisti]|uniref:Uncharacterized protein n=1 Tax=Kribbella sancticallisti TaxID=460087 RepID=A0ABP4P5E4_9ACTN